MFNLKMKIMGDMEVTVVAKNREEAERILNDTINSITIKDIKEKLTHRDDVEIKNSNVVTKFMDLFKEREAER